MTTTSQLSHYEAVAAQAMIRHRALVNLFRAASEASNWPVIYEALEELGFTAEEINHALRGTDES